jgi:hypothetical protein
MENIKIGITLGLKSIDESIWTNGIKQNVLYLIRLLKNSKKNYDVYLLNATKLDFSEKRPSYLEGIQVEFFDEKFMEMDLLIMMGAQIMESNIAKFKESGKHKKVIAYKCGNNYAITMENILFKEDEGKTLHEHAQNYDEVWYIPQQDEVNSGFYKTLYRTNALIVPFIWHNQYLYESILGVEKAYKEGRYKKGYKYDPTRGKKTLGIMEPNINIVKFSLLPAMIAEESYRGKVGKEKIDRLMISNADRVKKHPEFMSYIRTFDLFKDKKVSGESRYQTAYFLTQHLDILICHQILNPLNYLYLDAAYLGYPVLHNAYLCKDLGYYYEGSDTRDAAKVLDYILTEHDNNIMEYHERNNEVLNRYYADNERLVEEYDMLIDNLFNGGNDGLIYDSSTNLYTEESVKYTQSQRVNSLPSVSNKKRKTKKKK